MMSNNEDKIRSLWPLPGGNDQYLETLVQALQWLYQKEDITVDEELNAWLQKEYHVGETTAPGYIRVIKYLGAIDIDPRGRITITSFGDEIVNAEDRHQQADLVVHRFMNNYLGFPEVLAIYDKLDEAIHLDSMVEKLMPQFPKWTSSAQYEYRALWLLSLGCLEQDRGRYYQITEYGKSIASQYPVNIEVESIVVSEPTIGYREDTSAAEDELDVIICELKESARDSRNPDRFEAGIASAFEFLGFKVDQLGETGDTDVLLSAEIGTQSYRVVVDGKSRSSGRLSDFRSFPLEQHRENNKADFIVVVAEDFAGGNVEMEAYNNKIVLMSVEILCKWLKIHKKTPFNLLVQRTMFEEAGRVRNLSVTLKSVHDQRIRWAKLIIDLIQQIDETYSINLLDPLSTQNLFIMLAARHRGVQYSEKMVEEAVQLLSHEALGNIMKKEEKGVILQMNPSNAAASLRSLADMLELFSELSE
jgi:Mn-dependent DtxR family transcriptional regulator